MITTTIHRHCKFSAYLSFIDNFANCDDAVDWLATLLITVVVVAYVLVLVYNDLFSDSSLHICKVHQQQAVYFK